PRAPERVPEVQERLLEQAPTTAEEELALCRDPSARLLLRVGPRPELAARQKYRKQRRRGRHDDDLEGGIGRDFRQAHDQPAVDAPRPPLGERTAAGERLQVDFGVD